ncbi:MAG: 50S ribosomal protein L25 [Patescibacteria group bacterium]
MISLSVKIRKSLGRKVLNLRKRGILPGNLYGPALKASQNLEIDRKNFEKVYKEAGESSLISLELENKQLLVLIHEVQEDPLTQEIIHVDFYQPRLDKEIEVRVPIIFEGISKAVKELEGTLVKNISEVEIKALPQKLPKEIKVNIGNLETFKDRILIKDLIVGEGIKILKNQDEIVALVTPPEKIEEELAKPIEEKVEDVEKIEKPEKVEQAEEVE